MSKVRMATKKEVFRSKVHKFFDEAAERLKTAFSDAWEFLYPFIKVFMSEVGQAVAAAAIEAVQAIADSMGDADGNTKREEAKKIILAKLESQGIKVGISVIYAAIEAAVQKLKAK